ncbi:MAG: Holliday junction resolvase RuvX [Planctomycetes bacterium]|nr:Holliday junction resolvase RuvX [Planctomycetota bacterium]
MTGRFVGLDPGEKRIGVAVSDALGLLARPVGMAEGEEALDAMIRDLASEGDIAGIVVGLPRNMDGSLGPKAREAEAFAERLRVRTGLTVDLWDERLSTVEASRQLAERGIRGRRQAERIDAAAARVILQGFLDARRQARPQEPS